MGVLAVQFGEWVIIAGLAVCFVAGIVLAPRRFAAIMLILVAAILLHMLLDLAMNLTEYRVGYLGPMGVAQQGVFSAIAAAAGVGFGWLIGRRGANQAKGASE